MAFPKTAVMCYIFIPKNFVIVSARATLIHANVNWSNANNDEIIGYSRNVNLYKSSDNMTTILHSAYFSESTEYATNLIGEKISNAFGENGFTASGTSGEQCEYKISNDIGSSLETGLNVLYAQTTDTTNATSSNWDDALAKTGRIKLEIDVLGYMSINN